MTGNKDVKQLTRSAHHLLKRAAQYAATIYMDRVGKSGLTQRQYTVLAAVNEHDGVSQTALVRMTGIDRSTLADLVARLLAQGYLQRRRSKDDGRANSVRITAAGKRVLRAASPGADDSDRLMLQAISPSLRKPFLEALALLADEMDKLENASGKKLVLKIRPRRRA
jgi:DNA-binding MarR family transcriptional regulator